LGIQLSPLSLSSQIAVSRPSLLQQLQPGSRSGGGAARSTSETRVECGTGANAAIAPTAKEKEYKRFQPNNARKTEVL
jgi:hypothetical protein